jgi:Lrp/AsnC family leucine-responsive transcriptional regulator
MLCYLIKQSRKGFVVFCHLKLIQHTKEFVTKFESEVVQLKEVLECYHVSGDYDILKIVVKDMEAYRVFSHKINNTSAYW